MLLFCLALGFVDGLRGVLDLADSRVLARNRQNRADNEESVALGLARTGRVVTAAALLMAVTFASLVAADVSVMRIFGVGVRSRCWWTPRCFGCC